MTLDDIKAQFALFLSPVEGHHVARFGTHHVIGGVREKLEPGSGPGGARDVTRDRGVGRMVLRLDRIVAIPHAEAELYRREYGKAIARRNVRERTAEEYLEQLTRTLAAEKARPTSEEAMQAARDAAAKAQGDKHTPSKAEE